jgi:hypothetical protein
MAPGGTGAGCWKPIPFVKFTAEIDTVPATGIGPVFATMIEAHPCFPPAEAQIAMPGVSATAVIAPDVALTDTLLASLVVHATVYVAPASAFTAATMLSVWPTDKVAVAGDTVTLLTAGVGVTGWMTLTLSPHAAATTAAAARRVERRTFM